MAAKFTMIDLFAGIGGFRIAAERCGGECVGFSEIDADAIEAYTVNHNGHAAPNLGDIRELKDLPKHDLLTGGVPCQSWSIAGRNMGFDDDRGQLWNDALCLLHQSKPEAFIFENVKGLADARNKDALIRLPKRAMSGGKASGCVKARGPDGFVGAWRAVPAGRIGRYVSGGRSAHKPL